MAILGTTKAKYLLSNVESLNISLSKDDLVIMEQMVPWTKVQGARAAPDVATWVKDNKKDNNPELTAELAHEWSIPFEQT